MADEKNLKQEELQDDQLDQVAGGSFRLQGEETVFGDPHTLPIDSTDLK